jgi:hypothetical protein
MIPLGLRKAQLNQLHDLLESSHNIYIRVRLLDLEHKYIADLSNRFVDGQVNIDADAEVTRSLDIVIADPNKSINIDADSPDEGAMYLNNMISVVYVVHSPSGHLSFDIPVFCGPIDQLSRNGAFIDVTCLGKESLSMANMWKSRSFKKNLAKTHVIKIILNSIMGENKTNVPERKARLPRNLSLGRANKPWVAAKWLASSMGCQLFYDGRGVARFRAMPSKSVFVFREKNMTSVPEFGYDLSDVVNAVEVIGAKPKGAKHKLRLRMVAPRSHPLSPFRLGRNGVPRVLPLFIEDDQLKNKREMRARAKRELRNGLLEAIDAAFDSLPIPHLEELDVSRLSVDDYAMSFRLRTMTIPLVASGTSSIGYLKRVTPPRGRRAVRRKRKRNRKKRSRNGNRQGN